MSYHTFVNKRAAVIDMVRGIALPWDSLTAAPWHDGKYTKVRPFAAWAADTCFMNVLHEDSVQFASVTDRSLRVCGTDAGLAFEFDIFATSGGLGVRGMLS
jgi:hypothetical protein